MTSRLAPLLTQLLLLFFESLAPIFAIESIVPEDHLTWTLLVKVEALLQEVVGPPMFPSVVSSSRVSSVLFEVYVLVEAPM